MERQRRNFHTKGFMLSLGSNRDAHFGSTIMSRRAGGLLQSRGAGKRRGIRRLQGDHAVIVPQPGCPLSTDDVHASGRGGLRWWDQGICQGWRLPGPRPLGGYICLDDDVLIAVDNLPPAENRLFSPRNSLRRVPR